MIRFLPDLDTVSNELRRQELIQFCESFTKKNIDVACQQHLDYENIVLIGTGTTIGFKIVDTCCQSFYQKLVQEFGEAIYR